MEAVAFIQGRVFPLGQFRLPFYHEMFYVRNNFNRAPAWWYMWVFYCFLNYLYYSNIYSISIGFFPKPILGKLKPKGRFDKFGGGNKEVKG